MRVMATVDFDHDGTERKRGQIFDMTREDNALWGGFVRILGVSQQVTKPATVEVTKDETAQGAAQAAAPKRYRRKG